MQCFPESQQIIHWKVSVSLTHLFSLRPEEFLHDCPYFALWSLDSVITMTSSNLILDIVVHERSLSRGVPPSYPPPEQFFHPGNYNFGRYFPAFDSDKLKQRSDAAYWFFCLLLVAQKAKQTREHQTPTNPITGSTRYLESYVVLTRY